MRERSRVRVVELLFQDRKGVSFDGATLHVSVENNRADSNIQRSCFDVNVTLTTAPVSKLVNFRASLLLEPKGLDARFRTVGSEFLRRRVWNIRPDRFMAPRRIREAKPFTRVLDAYNLRDVAQARIHIMASFYFPGFPDETFSLDERCRLTLA